MADYIKSFTGHVDTVHQVRGLHRRAGDFMCVSEPPVQTLLQLDELEDTIVLNGSHSLRKGDYLTLHGLTRVQLDNNGIKEYLIPTGGYEVFNDRVRAVPKGSVVCSFDRRASTGETA